MPDESTSADAKAVPFKMHPRVFQALGSELVTSDVVAVIELVKNSYDAFATHVEVRFGMANAKLTLEVADNGQGMTKEIIDDVWCMVATPFRQDHPRTHRGGKTRRTTGAKGLGRLSAARLGQSMTLVTKARDDRAWQVDVDWSGLSSASSVDACCALRGKYTGSLFRDGTGTSITIHDLNSHWRPQEVEELSEALSRLMSPFEAVSDFDIFLTPPGAVAVRTKIQTSEFLKHPPYSLKGSYDRTGTLKYTYSFHPFRRKGRSATRTFDWAIVQRDINDTLPKEDRNPAKEQPTCGPFSFEIRVWDLDQKSMADAESRFEIRRSLMRRQIRAFKGISLYRDGVLVLPKSENNRDWLGLDLRRVSKVGTRLSTSQMVGYVSISADANPHIEDTSDRERLARNEEVQEFERLLRYAVSRLELERDQDQEAEEPQLRELFEELSPEKLLSEAQEIVSENGAASDVLPLLNEFSKKAEKAREQIEKQFFYYSRLATIGTISQMLVHEVGNNCGALDAFVNAVRDWLENKLTDRVVLERRLALAKDAVAALQRLAERFRPLASRAFQRGKRNANLKEVVDACLETLHEPLKQGRVAVECVIRNGDVQIDPGELYPIVYNLIDNAVYWLHHSKPDRRRLKISSSRRDGMVVCEVSDSGPGIAPKDKNRIFNAGVTRKPNGSGMGLTVAGELVEGNKGTIGVQAPGKLGGATFRFELPAVSAAR